MFLFSCFGLISIAAINADYSEEINCTLCRKGPIMFPDRVVPTSGGMTCLEVEQETLAGVSRGQCDLHRNFLAVNSTVDIFGLCGCPEIMPSTECALCENDATSITIDRDGHGDGHGESTCNELSATANYVVDNNLCQGIQIFAGECCHLPDVINEVVDSTNEDACTFCENHNVSLIDPDNGIPAKKGFTCADVRDVAGFFHTESHVCKVELASLAHGCCKSEGRCSLCSDRTSKIRYPDKVIPFSNEGSRCIDVEFGLGYLDNEECSLFHDKTSTIDLASWCGCEDAELTAPTCSLCVQWDVVSNAQISDLPEGVTCQTISEWAPFVRDYALCDAFVTLLRGECCGRDPFAVPDTSPSTPAPSTATDLEWDDQDMSSSTGKDCALLYLASVALVATLSTIDASRFNYP